MKPGKTAFLSDFVVNFSNKFRLFELRHCGAEGFPESVVYKLYAHIGGVHFPHFTVS